MQNPVTGSGGMFIGKVAYIGEDLDLDIKVGDKIASLVSLSMTPLKIDEIIEIHPEIDRVDIKGQAVLFESALYAKLPDDISEPLALAALDVGWSILLRQLNSKPGSERSGSWWCWKIRYTGLLRSYETCWTDRPCCSYGLQPGWCR